MGNKMKATMKSVIGNLLFIAILLLLTTRIFSVMADTAFPVDLVNSNSMSPSLMEGDVVAWVPVEIEDIQVGDVVVFKSWLSWPEERLVLHRVVEIKDEWGEPALVTKGDANKHTDQAGPHIPEPYVTDKNLIGKAVSIGNQPLKIPFIGYLGIWSNELFKQLAQPTADKGAMAYVGIFTPLTLSTIILVVGIFVLPEKHKSLKEKLRFYILGSHNLDLKKIFIFFFIIYFAFFGIIHCFAYDSTSASVGVDEFPDKGHFELGSVSAGQQSMRRQLPVYNPSILPVKGVVYGSETLHDYVDKQIFEVNPGKSETLHITASAPEHAQRGVYIDDLLLYSSPFWFIIPDEIFNWLMQLTGENVVMYLDVLSALFLTVLTILLMVVTSIGINKVTSISIDWSWSHIHRYIFKKHHLEFLKDRKNQVKHFILEKYGWIVKVPVAQIDCKKPIIASLIIIPFLFLISDELLAMTVAALCAGFVAYMLSCKQRRKIVFTVFMVLSISILYCMVTTNYMLVTSQHEFIEIVALGMGAIGVYTLVLAFFLIPIGIIIWYFTRLMRNLKEYKEPFTVLEGHCDL